MKTTAFLLFAPIFLLSACSTPQVAMDHANHGAALTASLHHELRGFRHTQASIAAARIDTVKEIERRIEEYQRSSSFNNRIAQLARRDHGESLYVTLSGLADTIANDEAAAQRRLNELNERFEALLKPLPDSATKLLAVQKALAVLGTELSAAERIELFSGFIRELGDDIKNSKAAAETAAKPKQAPVQ